MDNHFPSQRDVGEVASQSHNMPYGRSVDRHIGEDKTLDSAPQKCYIRQHTGLISHPRDHAPSSIVMPRVLPEQLQQKRKERDRRQMVTERIRKTGLRIRYHVVAHISLLRFYYSMEPSTPVSQRCEFQGIMQDCSTPISRTLQPPEPRAEGKAAAALKAEYTHPPDERLATPTLLRQPTSRDFRYIRRYEIYTCRVCRPFNLNKAEGTNKAEQGTIKPKQGLIIVRGKWYRSCLRSEQDSKGILQGYTRPLVLAVKSPGIRGVARFIAVCNNLSYLSEQMLLGSTFRSTVAYVFAEQHVGHCKQTSPRHQPEVYLRPHLYPYPEIISSLIRSSRSKHIADEMHLPSVELLKHCLNCMGIGSICQNLPHFGYFRDMSLRCAYCQCQYHCVCLGMEDVPGLTDGLEFHCQACQQR
ncbi:hypothetical protein PR048_002117 [Dryococelus australis]|uniref:Uncharacterized protein n=1 Tax=Dryococelus australis TaxID=614101 RepID=A0ABQ9IJE2_9NEOP|nr:hypothetical protein PR048_002117 [Dryococelus australis]